MLKYLASLLVCGSLFAATNSLTILTPAVISNLVSLVIEGNTNTFYGTFGNYVPGTVIDCVSNTPVSVTNLLTSGPVYNLFIETNLFKNITASLEGRYNISYSISFTGTDGDVIRSGVFINILGSLFEMPSSRAEVSIIGTNIATISGLAQHYLNAGLNINLGLNNLVSDNDVTLRCVVVIINKVY